MYVAALILAMVLALCGSLTVILVKWVIAQLGIMVVASLFMVSLLLLLIVMGDKEHEK